MCRRAAKILEPLDGIDADIDRLLIQALGNLGNILRHQGRYHEAEAPILQALSIAEKVLAEDDLDVAITLNYLGIVYKYLARFVGGERVYHRSLAIMEKVYGPDDPHLASLYHNLGGLEHTRGDYAKGEPYARRSGDRLLLEGPSGGGKSTLANLLTGLRQPESGLLLLHGLDRQTLGDAGWRQRIVAAPQFHENHVLTGTFAFNLLMGRHWPPRPEDVAAAETLCQELGLGDLLERMPAGLLQMVGETGWQLSHGERSRLYLARALLQEADLTILDESFAALDPENMERALRCVLNRAKTLLVIAHP